MESIKKTIHSEKVLSKERQKIVSNTDFDLTTHKRIWHKCSHDWFVYTEPIKEIIPELIKYFNGQECIYDLGKGIYIHGKFGIGKSTIMTITRRYLERVMPFHPNAYRISSIEKIANHFKSENNLDLFSFNMKTDDRGTHKEPINLLINEFGTERDYTIKSYGSVFIDEYNSMLMARYEVFTEFKKLTHCTSNFGLKELSSLYPEKLLDRFVEMFNFIELEGESWRK
jgi:hypothetical protein